MINQETARAIYNCYAEIKNSEKLLEEIAAQEKRLEEEQKEAFHSKDIKETHPMYQLGVPSNFGSDSAWRLYRVRPSMAKAVIIAHLAEEKAHLAELNQRAKLEAGTLEDYRI
jgi:hypothetical protein